MSISRRSMLKTTAVAGVGLVIGCRIGSTKEDQSKSFAPNVFVRITPDGMVTITVSKSDMGQGVRTSLAMIVAEELDADWSKVKVVQAPADSKYRGQGTGGSGSVRGMFSPLRVAGATARAMLVAAAAKKWGVNATDCATANGFVTNGANRLSYGELATDAAAMPEPERSSVVTKDPSKFNLIGKATKRVDNVDVVTGKAIFSQDVHVKGMKYAVIARPPSFSATLDSIDDSAAIRVPGVIKVAKLDQGVVVFGESTWAALQGRDALKVRWNLGDGSKVNSASIRRDLKAAIPANEGGSLTVAQLIKAEYELPFLAHATMEPMNCVADVRADSVEIWAGTQAPESAQAVAARIAGVATSKVKVNVMLLGGGFGRRFQPDFIDDAVRASKLLGAPVKLFWSRDDDMKHDHYRPATHHVLEGGLDQAGAPIYWNHRLAEVGGGNGRQRRAGLVYEFPQQTVTTGGVDAGIPTGPWRSVENSFMGFVNESFFDELAHLAKRDPLEFRLAYCRSERLKKCLQLAAEKAGWGRKLPAGHAMGIACFAGYGSNIAQVVELSVTKGIVKVHRVVAAVDCGITINPLGVEAQVLGATMDALSTALKASITIENHGVVESTFSDYEWLRMEDSPKVEVHIIPSAESPGGMGEVGYPSVSAAVVNGIFAATGKRIRRLPVQASDF